MGLGGALGCVLPLAQHKLQRSSSNAAASAAYKHLTAYGAGGGRWGVCFHWLSTSCRGGAASQRLVRHSRRQGCLCHGHPRAHTSPGTLPLSRPSQSTLIPRHTACVMAIPEHTYHLGSQAKPDFSACACGSADAARKCFAPWLARASWPCLRQPYQC